MRFKKYENIIPGAIFLAIAVLYAIQIPSIRISNFAPIDSAFFPKVLCTLLAMLAIIQIVFGIKSVKNIGDDVAVSNADYVCVLQTLAMAVVYVALLRPAGFIVSSIVYLFFQMTILCPKAEAKPAKFLIIAIVTSIVVFFIFRNGLGLMLPEGFLKGLF